jgi:aminotransferase
MPAPTAVRSFVSQKAARFEESVIRRMTQVCLAHKGINLAQGFPDFPTPPELQEAAVKAIRDGYNQYARTWGAPQLVEALAEKVRWFQGMAIDPNTQVTVCCGSTEAMISALLATVNPGDEVIVTSPFYENYGADTILCGATPRYLPLHPVEGGGFQLDPADLVRAFNKKTRGIIINTPHNPCGKVYTEEELSLIAKLCEKFDCLAFTDEIYEHIIYDGRRHVSIATLPGMAERTITISGMSKTYSATGWRVAWAIASPQLTAAIRKVHDFLTVGAPHPLQIACATALRLPRTFYDQLAQDYAGRREAIWSALQEGGLEAYYPEGAYYILLEIGRFQRAGEDDTAFALRLVKECGVASVPGSSFYNPPSLGHHQVRVCFCKKIETLRDAGGRLVEWAAKQTASRAREAGGT